MDFSILEVNIILVKKGQYASIDSVWTTIDPATDNQLRTKSIWYHWQYFVPVCCSTKSLIPINYKQTSREAKSQEL
jgi:hypothetical protein